MVVAKDLQVWVSHLCARSFLCIGLEKDLSHSYKDTGYGLMTLVASADLSPSLEAPLPNTVTLEVRASIYKLGEQGSECNSGEASR